MVMSYYFRSEIERESVNTRKLLELLPEDKFDWLPHANSMTLIKLASHISNLIGWPAFTIELDELDLAKDLKPFVPANSAELLENFDNNLAKSLHALENVSDETLLKNWTLKKGERVIVQQPKAGILRVMCTNHLIHHRGQLSVYLRLLDIPIPGMYGPSYDEIQQFATQN
jgi:uncharacterized damage-inducible protein DinB